MSVRPSASFCQEERKKRKKETKKPHFSVTALQYCLYMFYTVLYVGGNPALFLPLSSTLTPTPPLLRYIAHSVEEEEEEDFHSIPYSGGAASTTVQHL